MLTKQLWVASILTFLPIAPSVAEVLRRLSIAYLTYIAILIYLTRWILIYMAGEVEGSQPEPPDAVVGLSVAESTDHFGDSKGEGIGTKAYHSIMNR